MNPSRSRPANFRRSARLSAAALASLALTAIALPATAAAGQTAATTRPAARQVRASPLLTAYRAALARAKATRQPVTVLPATTETSQTIAHPGGYLTNTTYVLPVRVKQAGAWVPLSARLRQDPADMWSPAAAPSGLSLSGGGTGPMAILASPAGGKITLTFPGPLPVPVISGDTATYRSVRPGTDLQLTATPLGGLQETFIIRGGTASAAALRQVRLGLKGTGLAIARHPTGEFSAAAGNGTSEFTMSSPQYEDPASTRAGAGITRPGAGPAPASPGKASGAGGAASALVPASYSGQALTLSPAPARLATATAAQPALIGTTIVPATFTAPGFTTRGNQTGYTQVKAACPAYTGWNNGEQYGNGVGYQQYSPDCGSTSLNPVYTMYRAAYQIDTTGLDPSMKVQKAILTAWVNYGSDWTCTDKWPLTVHWTNGISASTNWNTLVINPADKPQTDQVQPGPNPSSACTTQVPTWNVTYAITQAAAGNWANWTFGIWGNESKVATNYGFMRVGDNPDIITTFDLAPQVPTGAHTVPAAADTPGGAADNGCNTTGTYGWVNQPSPAFAASIAANITNEQVRALYNVWDNKNGGTAITGEAGPSAYYQGTGTATAPAILPLQDGHQYGWSVQANVDGSTPGASGGTDGTNTTGYTSAASASCYFNIDLTPPAQPTAASTTFPPSGGNTTNGSTGTFTFTSPGDPVPAGPCNPAPCLASGLYQFRYTLNSGTPAYAPATGGTATASITIGNWGTNILQVQAQDAAGNLSQPAYYTFYVPWNNGITPVPGDVNGDGAPDLLATTSSGGLNLYPGNIPATTGSFPAATSATAPGQSPDNGSDWNTFQITHRGSYIQQGSYDDLVAHKGSAIYFYKNNPSSPGTSPYANTANYIQYTLRPACSTTTRAGNCTGYSTSWTPVTQILSPGDAWAGTAGDGCGTPSLLTVENDALWLYQGGCGTSLQNPVKLGTTGWASMTLIAPGIIGGQPTIWARDNTTGNLYSYPITIAADAQPTLNPASPGTPIPAEGTGSTATLIPGITLTQAAYPVLASTGDTNTTGAPTLIAIDTTGNVIEYPGNTGNSSTTNPLSATPVTIGSVPVGSITQLS